MKSRTVLSVPLSLFTMFLSHGSNDFSAQETPGQNVRRVVLNDDGAWCWFQDERAIVVNDEIVLTSVANGSRDSRRRGNLEVSVYDLESGLTQRVVLHEHLEADDHDSAALLVRGDGRLLAMYARHGREAAIRYRVSTKPGNALSWQPAREFVPSATSRVTYANLFRLTGEDDRQVRIYNFFRGYDNHFKPSWMYSNDEGNTWSVGGLLIDVPSRKRHRPYVKYASNDRDEVHFAFTEGHPRVFDNSVYHAFYKAGAFYQTAGSRIRGLREGPLTPREATRVFRGDKDNVAWTSDLHLDTSGRPVIVYSVQKNAAGLRSGHPEAGADHRYRYARWDGTRWHDHEVGHAGTRLYPGEDDYTGNICIDPDEVSVVYLSTDVDVRSGEKRGLGRYEIHRGVTGDFGKTWKFTAVTRGSEVDNIRPMVPRWNPKDTALLWLRGTYRSYTEWDLEVVGEFTRGAP